MSAAMEVKVGICERCGVEGPVERVEDWNYCPVHAADWRGYLCGVRFQALINVREALTAAMQACTLEQVGAVVTLTLQGERVHPNGIREPGCHEDDVQSLVEDR
jgi:hypothetical protein